MAAKTGSSTEDPDNAAVLGGCHVRPSSAFNQPILIANRTCVFSLLRLVEFPNYKTGNLTRTLVHSSTHYSAVIDHAQRAEPSKPSTHSLNFSSLSCVPPLFSCGPPCNSVSGDADVSPAADHRRSRHLPRQTLLTCFQSLYMGPTSIPVPRMRIRKSGHGPIARLRWK